MSNLGLGRSVNPSMSQLGSLRANPNASKTSLNSNRTTTKSQFNLPPSVVPVSGSFLFFDEKKNRLSDLGSYKTAMRNVAAPEIVYDIFEGINPAMRVPPGVALR